MSLVYAWAKIHWLPPEENSTARLARGRVIAPSIFSTNKSQWWSLFLFLKAPVYLGETVILPVTTMVEEVAEGVLRPGVSFVLKRGPKTVAQGEVLSAEHVDRDQYNFIFQFNE